jgi:hypothetical protein
VASVAKRNPPLSKIRNLFMKNTLSQLKLAALALTLLGLGDFTAQGASTLGFNYWPSGWGCPNGYCDSRVLNDANWPANKALVQRNLDQMASLGCGMVRLMLYPQATGWYLENGNGPGGSNFRSEFTEQKRNIVDLIGMCKARNMRVIITFGNSFLNYQPPPNQNVTWWQGFPTYNSNFAPFLWDTIHWINGFADSIENSAYATSVYFYDIENEYARNLVNAAWYSTYVFDASSIPPLKKGHSVLSLLDAEDLRVNMGSRVLKFTDIHCYPTTCPADRAILEDSYDAMRAKFPGSITIMGEFARWTQYTTDEANQNCTVKDVAGRAKDKGIPYHLHWLFLDNEINPQNYFGLGYQPHQMKDAMGGLITVENLIPNADLESLTGVPAVPTGWGFGSNPSGNTTFAPVAGVAQTNTYCGRVTRALPTGSVFLNAPGFAVSGSSTKKLYINFFFRSNMTGIYPVIHEYDQNWYPIGTLTGTSYTPGTWTWFNYREIVGSQSFALASGTKNIIISIVGTSVSNNSMLDVDTISAFEQ